jgi:sugar lactone lactonase YvrE
MARKKIHIISLLTMMAAFSLIGSCASTDEKQDSRSKPVWPPPPATARIAFEQSFSTPEELGIEKSFWQWLGDFVFGADESHMVRPMAVITIADRLIFVADPGVRGVHRFDTRDNSYQLIKGLNGVELPSPVALATDGNGNVFVTDSKLAKLFVIHKEGKYALPVDLDSEILQPTGIAINVDNGDIYLVDTRQHQILVFNRSGKLKKQFGKRGIGPGEFNYPTLIWENNGTLLVTDALNFRIQSFDLNGNYLSSFGKAGQSSGRQSRPKGIATDQDGHIYVVDALLNNIQLFDHYGQYLMTIGERGQLPGMFWLPVGIYISPQQKIYVADSHNRRVQIFRYIDDL